jgi:hypothetical protein
VNSQFQADNIQFVGNGRKYFIKAEELRISAEGDLRKINFNFPEARMSQVQDGPQMTQTVSRFLKITNRPQLSTIVDNLDRSISHAVLHFSDGTSASIPQNLLPKTFSLRSDEGQNKLYLEAQQRADRLWRAMDYGRPSAPAPPACRKIFSRP